MGAPPHLGVEGVAPPGPLERIHARREVKYVVRPETARRLLALLGPALVLDPHAARRPSRDYTVRSLYLDNPSFECFRLKTGGQRFREKYRLRTYDAPGAPLRFELKQKWGSRYRKLVVPVDPRALDPGAHGSLADWVGAAGDAGAEAARQRLLYRLHARAYRPVVLVAYERAAFVGAVDDTVRLTLDRGIRARACSTPASIHDESRWTHLLADWVVLEVKFTRRAPGWLGLIHRRGQLKPQACSKYCTAVGALFDEGGLVRARHA